MSRLYYESEVRKKKPRLANAVPEEEDDSSDGQSIKGYLEKVSSLIPAEVIAGYLAMFGFVPLIDSQAEGGLSPTEVAVAWAIFALCLILTPVYLNYQAEKGRPKKIHLIVSTIAFVIWAYVTTGSSLVPDLYNAAIGSILLVAFSLISGLIKLNK